MYVKKQNSTQKVAYGGILLAVNMILLMMIDMIPMNTLFIMGLASLPIAIIVIEFDVKLSFIFYIASSLLSLFIMSNKSQWLLYVFTFGNYGMIKYIIEKKNLNYYIDIIVKLIYANVIMAILCYLLTKLIYIPINIYTVAMFQVIFIIYDYVYSQFIDYYYDKLRKIIKNNSGHNR